MLTIRLDDHLENELQLMAARAGESKSAFVRHLIENAANALQDDPAMVVDDILQFRQGIRLKHTIDIRALIEAGRD
jgi:predicted DNA-binding protein